MAKFRRTYAASRSSGLIIGTVSVVLLVVLCLFLLRRFMPLGEAMPMNYVVNMRDSAYLPSARDGQIVHHTNFSLSYLEKFEQAQWVAYELTRDELDAPRVPRTNHFNTDYSVTTQSAYYRDYIGSGYTRGHLAPAADMAFDTLAMRESFYMSNMSPQVRAFNNGIWRELEEQTRDWARRSGRLYIITGPVLSRDLKNRIGQNRVVVPDLFYKVILNPDDPDMPNIAFLIPNALSSKPLMDYAVTIDAVEHMTSLDFYYTLDGRIHEDSFDAAKWPVNKMRYDKRVKEWNNE